MLIDNLLIGKNSFLFLMLLCTPISRVYCCKGWDVFSETEAKQLQTWSETNFMNMNSDIDYFITLQTLDQNILKLERKNLKRKINNVQIIEYTMVLSQKGGMTIKL